MISCVLVLMTSLQWMLARDWDATLIPAVPECTMTWLFKFVCLLKPLKQTEHLKGQHPLWTYLWDLKSPGVGNDFGQMSHLWGFIWKAIREVRYVASWRTVRYFGVGHFVVVQIRARCEFFPTFPAHVRFHAGVDSSVCVQRAGGGESLLAHLADVWFFTWKYGVDEERKHSKRESLECEFRELHTKLMHINNVLVALLLGN